MVGRMVRRPLVLVAVALVLAGGTAVVTARALAWPESSGSRHSTPRLDGDFRVSSPNFSFGKADLAHAMTP